ncbi:MAG: hypothetical protein IAX21_03795 [Candidatus Bathyarchaeota archaeon]|nr:MAG: hypothetical protein IAX21_03795 [Candidatus Bathyarchaeota archaeon]
MSEPDRIKQTILSQLALDACCRIHLHYECCIKLGLSTEAKYNQKGNKTRICKDLPDNKFDTPFNELLASDMIRKIRAQTIKLEDEEIKLDKSKTVEQIGNYAFYEITKKGRNFLSTL